MGTEEDTLSLKIRDNGSGFDIRSATNGMGLGNIRARATEFGGTVEIESLPGEGSTICSRLKLEVTNFDTFKSIWLELFALILVASVFIWFGKYFLGLTFSLSAWAIVAAIRLFDLWERRKQRAAREISN